MGDKFFGGLVIIGTLLACIIFFPMAGYIFNWHRVIRSWPECDAIVNSSFSIDKDLTPSFRSTAEVDAIAFCPESLEAEFDFTSTTQVDDVNFGVVEITLKYPAEPQSLNWANSDKTNAEAATWSGRFTVHVNPSFSDNQRHLAFTSEQSVVGWGFATAIMIIGAIIGIGYGIFMMLSG